MDELAKVMPALSEQVQKSFVGGGSGSQSNPYTEAEYDSMLASGTWKGGFVENWGYVSSYGDVVVTGSYNNTSNNGSSGSNSIWGWASLGLGVAGDIGSGAQSILDDRGKYMPNGKIYTLKTPITVRLPIGVMDTNAQVLNAVRVGGKWMGLLGSIGTGIDIYNDFSSGNTSDGFGKTAFALAQLGCSFIPGYGWAISLGLGIVEQIVFD